jgi:hypothetical protein
MDVPQAATHGNPSKTTYAPKPATGEWDKAKPAHASDAKKHVHMREGIQLGESYFAPMEGEMYEEGMYEEGMYEEGMYEEDMYEGGMYEEEMDEMYSFEEGDDMGEMDSLMEGDKDDEEDEDDHDEELETWKQNKDS